MSKQIIRLYYDRKSSCIYSLQHFSGCIDFTKKGKKKSIGF